MGNLKLLALGINRLAVVFDRQVEVVSRYFDLVNKQQKAEELRAQQPQTQPISDLPFISYMGTYVGTVTSGVEGTEDAEFLLRKTALKDKRMVLIMDCLTVLAKLHSSNNEDIVLEDLMDQAALLADAVVDDANNYLKSEFKGTLGKTLDKSEDRARELADNLRKLEEQGGLLPNRWKAKLTDEGKNK